MTKKNIGYANVPIECADIGKALVFDCPLGKLPATVCDWPWFPAEKQLPDDLVS